MATQEAEYISVSSPMLFSLLQTSIYWVLVIQLSQLLFFLKHKINTKPAKNFAISKF